MPSPRRTEAIEHRKLGGVEGGRLEPTMTIEDESTRAAPTPIGGGGSTPLDLAIMQGHQQIYPILLRAGATQSQGTTPVVDAYL